MPEIRNLTLFRFFPVLLLAAMLFSPALAAGAEEAAQKEKAAEPRKGLEQEKAPEAPKGITREEAEKIVVARVNGTPVTLASLLQVMNRFTPREPATAAEVREQALSRLIFQELAYQESRSEGISVEKDKIDNSIANLKTNLGGEEQYAAFLAREGIKESDIRGRVERSLALEIIYNREVVEKASVPEAELREEYEKNKSSFVQKEKIRATDVFVRSDKEQDPPHKAKKLLAEIKDVHGGDPWKLLLDGTFLVRDYRMTKERDKELYEAAKELKKGELSGVITTRDGAHIIRLEEYAPEEQLTFEKVKDSLERRLRSAAQQKRMKEWEEELKKKAVIEIVPAKEWKPAQG